MITISCTVLKSIEHDPGGIVIDFIESLPGDTLTIMPRDFHRDTGELVTRPEYQREPYVRATLDDGTVVDGKATTWTSTRVNVNWHDDSTPSEIVAGVRIRRQSAWTEAENVQRIKRSEATKPDYHDDTEWFRQQEEL